MKKEKFVIISNDAMVYDDLEYLSHKFAFKRLMGEGSVVKTLRSIYPTVTYAVHTSMITGCYPDKTGVYNNENDELCVKSSDWHWFRPSNKCKTLLDAAKEKGLTTANVSGRLRVLITASITISPNIGRRQRKKQFSTHSEGQARPSE